QVHSVRNEVALLCRLVEVQKPAAQKASTAHFVFGLSPAQIVSVLLVPALHVPAESRHVLTPSHGRALGRASARRRPAPAAGSSACTEKTGVPGVDSRHLRSHTDLAGSRRRFSPLITEWLLVH
ncbi:hypothetical protein MRX96_049374, partial [Rhipicephalus microplus]